MAAHEELRLAHLAVLMLAKAGRGRGLALSWAGGPHGERCRLMQPPLPACGVGRLKRRVLAGLLCPDLLRGRTILCQPVGTNAPTDQPGQIVPIDRTRLAATPSGMPMRMPMLDRDAEAPLASQIAGHYARAIEAGHLRIGERLPPIREVARACEVTRTTVQE
ncbi:MAG: GntR family transcriptional regulator, partial [Planctomycetes bacterium]|nr:GntR family transcriptional regulator [Planctomycetota bacterium]